MYGQVANYENKFYINGQEILGIESLDVSYSHSATINKYLGFNGLNGNTSVSGPVTQKVSITRNLIYSDPLIGYITNNNSFSGSLNYNSNNYGFKSGYIDDYVINCAVGSVPKVTTNISVYDEMLTGAKNASGSIAAPSIYIPNQGSIFLTCDYVTTNRVVGFDLSYRTVKKPIYSIGSKIPSEVKYIGPTENSLSVQIDVDDAFLSSGLAFLSGIQNKAITLSIQGRTGNVLFTQSFPKASLISESLSTSADGGVKLTLNYIYA